MAFIGNAAEDAARQREVLVRMQEHGVDGLVVVASENTRADALEEGLRACLRPRPAPRGGLPGRLCGP